MAELSTLARPYARAAFEFAVNVNDLAAMVGKSVDSGKGFPSRKYAEGIKFTFFDIRAAGKAVC